MYKDKRILAVITARGGSKGLPGKNIRELNGLPLIAYTINSAKKSKYLDRIFVSTDSGEIAAISEKYGIKVPELRPKRLAEDNTSSVDVLLYTLDLCEKVDNYYDYMMLLEPTSPLRRDTDIDSIIEIAVDHPDDDGCISVGDVHLEHPSIVKKINKGGYIIPYVENGQSYYQRQMMDNAYFPYGVGYLVRTDRFRETKSIYMEHMLPFFIDRWQCYEIDDIYDFECISAVMKLEGFENG